MVKKSDLKYLLLLLLVSIVLFLTNYAPGTYLIGWDNLLPELNFGANWQRSLLAIWQEYRGLGLYDGMAHSANLIHTLYLNLLSFFLPLNSLRYVGLISLHLLGGIGLFFLAKKLTKNSPASFLASLFYLFNLGTIQQFFAPLEVFAFHFASLPWLIYLALKFIDKRGLNRGSLLLFFSAALLSTPQGFVPTIFITFLIAFSLVFAYDQFVNGNIKKSLILLAILLAANSFWLLPYLWGLPKNAVTIRQARINEFSSEEMFLRNKARGDLFSTLGLKGYMIDTVEYDTAKNKSVFLMDAWKKHTGTTAYNIGFLLILGGIFFGALTINQKKSLLAFSIPLAASIFFLGNNIILIRSANSFLRNILPIFAEAFRFPFTKFITIFTFSLAVFFALGLAYLFNKTKKALILVPTYFLIIIFLALPAFQGNFFSPLLKNKVPDDYFALFNYLKTKSQNERVALLPTHTYWNWQYRSWGQRGSGFLWYGLNQPILERAFDPWSGYNEQFYNEFSYAVNTKDIDLFKGVLQKYDITYLLLDQYIINNLSSKPINYDQIKRFLTNSDFLTKEKDFGKIILYKNSLNSSWIYTLAEKTTNKVYDNLSYTKKDQIFTDLGNYVTSNKNYDVIYPLATFYSEKLPEDEEFTAFENKDKIVVEPKNKISLDSGQYILEIPNLFEKEALVPVTFQASNGQLLIQPLDPQVFINNQKIKINSQTIVIVPRLVNKPTRITLIDINHTISLGQKTYLFNNYINTIKITDGKNEELIAIDTKKIKSESYKIALRSMKTLAFKVEADKFFSPFAYANLIKNKDYQKIKTSDNNEFSIWKDNLPHQASYMMFIDSQYNSGLPVNFYIDNPYEKRSELETRLTKKGGGNVVVLSKSQDYFQGYGFHFIFKKIGNEEAKTQINDFSLYPIPAETISGIKLVKKGVVLAQNDDKKPLDYKKITPFIYQINLKGETGGYLTLAQAYEEGWRAYKITNFQVPIFNFLKAYFPFIFGQELKDHSFVNNWANGWALRQGFGTPGANQIIIIFLPQYLEFLGFLVLIASFIVIIKLLAD